MNNIDIICNEKGSGKTTFALSEYQPNIYFNQEAVEYRFLNIIHNSDTTGTYCIIDSVDAIPECLFSNAMNHILSVDWKSIILIFDVVKSELIKIKNFNTIWECGLLPPNYEYSNFIASKYSFYSYLQRYYPELNTSSYDHIIEITEFNFRRIDRLLLINRINSERTDEINHQALATYVNETIQIKYKDLPDLYTLLEKASIIGEQFICNPLESPNGFGYEAASAVIKQMDEMHIFIRSCINSTEYYEFICHDVYQGIFNSISNAQKISWINILIQYYKYQYDHTSNDTVRLSLLNSLNCLYKLLPASVIERKKVCFILLYYYRKSDDFYHTLQILSEIIETFSNIMNSIELTYITNYRVQLLMARGEYREALEILRNYYDSHNYPGSRMLIKYYYAYCLFQTGNIDLSYELTKELVSYLKFTSGSNSHPQQLFCMTYSLMATIQNHLGIDDNGIRYFQLALKNAKSRLNNDIYYYFILRKCDMFYNYEQIKHCLKKCLHDFEKNGNWNYAGEVLINLATEMMFQDCKETKEIKKYFENAISYFSESKNEKLAYALNNFGIYSIIAENDVQKGLTYFKKALLVGLSDFSYMTIYLNICMCYILMNRIDSEQFTDARIRFDFAKKKLNKRQNESVYENIYEKILDILIDEHQGKEVFSRCKSILDSKNTSNFFVPLLSDIIKRNHNINDSLYVDNSYFYMKMNEHHCFFAEFRFWE